VTRNQTKPLSLKSKHTRKNCHASGLNENGSKTLTKGLNNTANTKEDTVGQIEED